MFFRRVCSQASLLILDTKVLLLAVLGNDFRRKLSTRVISFFSGFDVRTRKIGGHLCRHKHADEVERRRNDAEHNGVGRDGRDEKYEQHNFYENWNASEEFVQTVEKVLRALHGVGR